MKKKIVLGSIIFFIIDFISKVLIDNYFELSIHNFIIKDFFSITKVYNNGASWNMFSGHQLFLITISIVVLIFLFYYNSKFKENKRNVLAFSLIYGGIVGNLFDRIFNGYVIDFLDFYIFDYDYPVFNLADTWIVIGTILIIIAIYKREDVNDISNG